MYRKASPSVVVIRARGKEVSSAGVVRFGEIGSGVLVTQDGKVVTASHVVHGMEDITVEFVGRDPVRARLLGFQPGADLALLQLEVVPRDAPVATLADSDGADVGDPVFIIGAPYGLTYSLSSGIVSARWKPNTVNREFPLAEFFQTDATINTGNSGGPMFNKAGEVIGIVSHMITKSGGSEGLGFVVTANTVRKLLFEKRPFYLGVDGHIVSEPVAQMLNVPQAGGYLVKTVVKDSLGERLGLRGGDRSATIDGQQLVLGGDIILAAQGIHGPDHRRSDPGGQGHPGPAAGPARSACGCCGPGRWSIWPRSGRAPKGAPLRADGESLDQGARASLPARVLRDRAGGSHPRGDPAVLGEERGRRRPGAGHRPRHPDHAAGSRPAGHGGVGPAARPRVELHQAPSGRDLDR